MIDSHTRLQSLHGCKLNAVAWVVELTYLHIVVKCESLFGGHGKARCTVIHTISKGKEKVGESAITEIIEKILKESGIKEFVVNSRIINTFRKKIWLLKSKVEQMSYFVGIEFDMLIRPTSLTLV